MTQGLLMKIDEKLRFRFLNRRRHWHTGITGKN
jgi:hypothetical protein